MPSVEANEFLIRFGKNLRKLREKKGMGLRELAASCSIDYSDIGKIERGERNLTALSILELAKGLEIHPKKLMDFEMTE